MYPFFYKNKTKIFSCDATTADYNYSFFLCWVGERLRYYLACKMYAYKGQSTSKGQSEHVLYHVMQLRHRVCLHLYRLQLPLLTMCFLHCWLSDNLYWVQ